MHNTTQSIYSTHVIFQYDEEQETKRERDRKQKQLDGLEMQWQVRDYLALQLLASRTLALIQSLPSEKCYCIHVCVHITLAYVYKIHDNTCE